jgi:multimeric flavodoxin WrbA
MKVLALNGSPHKEGTVNAGLLTLCNELKSEGIEIELCHVGDEVFHGCTGCGTCRKTGLCALKDEANEYIEKARVADGIVLGSPVYYGGIAGGFKCLLDRMFFTGLNMQYKAAAAFVSLRRSGGIAVYHQLCNYLTLAGAVITPTIYWNAVHGTNGEEFKQDAEGVHIMQSVGRNMAWLMKSLETAKKTIALPEKTPSVRTNFIR